MVNLEHCLCVTACPYFYDLIRRVPPEKRNIDQHIIGLNTEVKGKIRALSL